MEKLSSEFSRTFQKPFYLLNRTNIDIFDAQSMLLLKYSRYIFYATCAIAFHLSAVSYVCKIFTHDIEFIELAYIVPSLMVATQGILKAAILVSKSSAIRTIILELGQTWRTTELTEDQVQKKNLMLRNLKLCQSVFYWMNILGSWQYMLTAFFQTLFRRFMLRQQCELLLPFGGRFPFDPTQSWPVYIAVYIFQVYSMFILIYIYLGAELLMVTICAHLSTGFVLLQSDLEAVRPISNKNVESTETWEGLENNIIKKHQKLILLSQNLNEIFNKIIFIDLLFATVIICFFGFIAKVARGPADMANNFVGVVASMLPIFNLCYYGESLTEASAGIANAAYKNLWYKGNTKYQKDICFVIKRSQKPSCITSLPYAPVTLKTFTKVLSTTWSYFSLATSLYEK